MPNVRLNDKRNVNEKAQNLRDARCLTKLEQLK